MPVLQFKGKSAIECYHHTVPHHTLEFDGKLSVLGKGEKPGLDGNLIIEGDNPSSISRAPCISNLRLGSGQAFLTRLRRELSRTAAKRLFQQTI